MSKKKLIISLLSVAAIAVIAGGSYVAYQYYWKQSEAYFAQLTPTQKLRAHTQEFVPPHITEVTDGVYVAVGYGLANSIMIEGTDGVIIVDTLESAESAVPVKKAFDQISGSKPVKAIIYTHNHPDHTFGAAVFAGKDNPQVLAYYTLTKELNTILSVIEPIMYIRSMRMYGNMLPPQDLINDGIGPAVGFEKGKTLAFVPPNQTYNTATFKTQIAGVNLVLIHAPGETNDQTVVWLPDKQVLLAGDNFYKAFPNIYTIRGTSVRDVNSWIHSLDIMLNFHANYLVPSHTNPLTGDNKIYTTLTHYRNAIQYIRDQTIREMNAGEVPDQIMNDIKLPRNLANDPYLQEYYGMVSWCVKAIFDQYLGWFSGDAKDLFPYPPKEKAIRMIDLAGGPDKLLQKAQTALQKQDYEWALILADDLLQVQADNAAAVSVKASALRHMANMQINANAHNYLLTQALEAEGKIKIVPPPGFDVPEAGVAAVPLTALFQSIGIRLNPLKADDKHLSVNFDFTDTKSYYSLNVCDDVLDAEPMQLPQVDTTIVTDTLTWKKIMLGFMTFQAAQQAGKLQVQGNPNSLIQLVEMLDK